MSKKLRELLTKRDTLDTEIGELSNRGAEIATADEATDEMRTELSELGGKLKVKREDRATLNELIGAEREADETRTAAVMARIPGDVATVRPEDRERMELRSRTRFRDFLVAVDEHRTADGAAGEYLDALGIKRIGRNGGTAFPMEMLAPPMEQRATSNTDTTVMPRRWLDRLFAGSAAMTVGVTMESVPAGVASFPVTTAGASAAQRQRSTDAAADAVWTVGVTEAKPKRNAVRAVFSIEDAARIPGLESALVRDLRMALVEGIDKAIFIGDAGATGNDADITGLRTAADVDEEELSQANKVKWPETVAAFHNMVDGLHAMTAADLKIVASVGAYRLWNSTTANTNRNESVGQIMRGNGLNFTSRQGIDTATLNGDFGAFVGLARGIEGAACMAMWEQGELIRDPFSAAAKGEVGLTINTLWDFVLPRPSNFQRLKFVT